MNYRESEREKALRIRDEFFNDPGNGEYLKVKYLFVLEKAEKNLWTKIERKPLNILLIIKSFGGQVQQNHPDIFYHRRFLV